MTEQEWFLMDDIITHWCRGKEEFEHKKPKGTHVDTSYWFHPTMTDKETQAVSCQACGKVKEK